MTPLAVAFGVLDLTDSPKLVGLVIASQTVAQVATQLLGGALADRWSRKQVMVAADLMAAASQTGLAVLFLIRTDSIASIAALMAVNGLGFALHFPAGVGLVPQVVPRERLQPANALLSIAGSAAYGLGGATAGVIVAVAGAGWAIAVDAATFALSAWLISGLRPTPQLRAHEGTSLLHELRDGWREFTAHRWLWAIVAQFSLMMAGWMGGLWVVGPVVAERSLGGPSAWAWVPGAFGAGLLAGGLVSMRLRVRRPMLVATLSVLPQALPILLLIGPAPIATIAAGAFLAGLGAELFGVLWNTALHTHIAPEALSRVSAYDVLGSIALAPVGEALAGPAVEAFGTETTLTIAAALIVVPTLAVLAVPEVRTLRNSTVSTAAEVQ